MPTREKRKVHLYQMRRGSRGKAWGTIDKENFVRSGLTPVSMFLSLRKVSTSSGCAVESLTWQGCMKRRPQKQSGGKINHNLAPNDRQQPAGAAPRLLSCRRSGSGSASRQLPSIYTRSLLAAATLALVL